MHFAPTIQQKSYERIVFILHRHPITFVPIVALTLLLLAIPFILYFLLISLYPDLFAGSLLYPIGVLMGSIYYLSIYLFFYVRFIDFYLDTWIVTNDRLIDIEQLGLFNRVIAELDLYRIQDVTTNVAGFFATIFNYGDVTVTTASYHGHTVFHQVARPNFIREQLILLAEEDRKYHIGQS